MSLIEEGNYLFAGNWVYWNIPRFSLSLRGGWIRSPLLRYEIYMMCKSSFMSMLPFWLQTTDPDDGFLGLIFHSVDVNDTPGNYFRFVVVDVEDREINFSYGEWIIRQDCNSSGYFRVPQLVKIKDAEVHSPIRILCQAVDEIPGIDIVCGNFFFRLTDSG